MHRVLCYENVNHKNFMRKSFLGAFTNPLSLEKILMYMICSFQSEQMCGNFTPGLAYGTKQSMGEQSQQRVVNHKLFLLQMCAHTPESTCTPTYKQHTSSRIVSYRLIAMYGYHNNSVDGP